MREVAPAVAGAEVAARRRGEAGRGDQRARGLLVARHERVPHAAAGVVVARVREAGVVERVDLERPPGQRLEPDLDEQRRARRVGRVGLGDPVQALGVRVDLPVAEAARVGDPGRVLGVLALAVGERAAVRDDQLQVARRRRAEVGVVDLGQLAVVQRVPDLAAQAGRRPEPVLVALGPQRRLARRARGVAGGARGGRRRGEHDEGERGGASPHPVTVNDFVISASELLPAYTSIRPGSTTNFPRLS